MKQAEFRQIQLLIPTSPIVSWLWMTDATLAATPQLDDTEQIDIVLTPLRKVIELIEEGDILQVLHISSIFLALKKLGKTHWK